MPDGLKTPVLLATVGISLILGFKYLFPIIAPFLLGLLLACWVEPLVKWAESRLKWRRGLIIGVILAILTLLILILTGLAVLALYREAEELLPRIPVLVRRIYFLGDLWMNRLTEIFPQLSSGTKGFATLSVSANHLFRSLAIWIMSLMPALPQIFLWVGLGGVTAFLFSRDKQLISSLFYRYIPLKWHPVMVSMKEEVFTTMAQYLRAQVTLAVITGVLTAVVFKLLDLPGAVAYGTLAGVLDLVPLFGSGLVFLPLVVVHFLFNSVQQAVWLLAAYFGILLIRQLAEIKLVGENLNFHPLLTIFVIYTGTKLFGIAGILVGPMIMILLRSISRAIGLLSTAAFIHTADREVGGKHSLFRT
jgi:sporulation integral membrane protein YtvI